MLFWSRNARRHPVPVYEYECERCGKVSSFAEKMLAREPLFFGRRKCPHCKSKKLRRVMSSFAAQGTRTYNEQLNELKSMGNVQFVPPQPKPPWGDGPPPGGCPYENAEKAETAKKTAAEEEKRKSPIVLGSS